MEITSIPYLIFGLAILLIFHLSTGPFKKYILLGSSYLFYGLISGPLLMALWLSTLINFKLSKSSNPKQKLIPIAFNIGLLLAFKISGLIENQSALIPIGISFFTFQAMGFVFDSARGDVKETTLIDFALFLAFFPQLIAGPIENYNSLGKQLEKPNSSSTDDVGKGLLLLFIGLFKKLILADRLAEIVNQFYHNPSLSNGTTGWIVVFMFSFQIFLDFSAYCEITIGTSKLFGIHLTKNFDRPYLKESLTQFWRSWHITLHYWFKKYLYSPVRKNANRYTAGFIVFALSGLWHGITLNFLLWGIVCFVLLILDQHFLQKWIPWKPFKIGITFLLVSMSWILFRIEDINDLPIVFFHLLHPSFQEFKFILLDFHYQITHITSAKLYGQWLIGGIETGLSYADAIILTFGLVFWGITTVISKYLNSEKLTPVWITILFLSIVLFGYNSSQPFIYLQF